MSKLELSSSEAKHLERLRHAVMNWNSTTRWLNLFMTLFFSGMTVLGHYFLVPPHPLVTLFSGAISCALVGYTIGSWRGVPSSHLLLKVTDFLLEKHCEK